MATNSATKNNGELGFDIREAIDQIKLGKAKIQKEVKYFVPNWREREREEVWLRSQKEGREKEERTNCSGRKGISLFIDTVG